jgi:hypothetical protein
MVGAELVLLRHGQHLYCVSDDPDVPALAWNQDLNELEKTKEGMKYRVIIRSQLRYFGQADLHITVKK